MQELFAGTLSQTSVYPREVVKDALRHNAAAVIFAQSRDCLDQPAERKGFLR
jgi:DNA repair protein RadC